MSAAPVDSPNLPGPAFIERLGKDDKIAAACLLGSAAADRLRADSDIDLAILPVPGKSFTIPERMNLAADLTALAGRPVDLGVLHTGNLVYAKEALVCGRFIFERDRAAKIRFTTLVFSMYADLQQNRREVLRAYAA